MAFGVNATVLFVFRLGFEVSVCAILPCRPLLAAPSYKFYNTSEAVAKCATPLSPSFTPAHPHPQQAAKYLKEMPASGVTPTLKHFKLALKACERATSRALTSGGSRGASSPSLSSSSAAAVLGGGTAGSGSGAGGGRQGWEAEVAAAVAAVPVIFELIRETPDLSPDDDCYSSAMRCAWERLVFISCVFLCDPQKTFVLTLFSGRVWRCFPIFFSGVRQAV